MRAEKELAARLNRIEARVAVVEQRLDGLHTAVKHVARALDGHEGAEAQALQVVVSGLGRQLELTRLLAGRVVIR